jgi:hypothetical protein
MSCGSVWRYCRVVSAQRSEFCSPLCSGSPYLISRWLRGEVNAVGTGEVQSVEWDGWYWKGTRRQYFVIVNTGCVWGMCTVLLANKTLMKRHTRTDCASLAREVFDVSLSAWEMIATFGSHRVFVISSVAINHRRQCVRWFFERKCHTWVKRRFRTTYRKTPSTSSIHNLYRHFNPLKTKPICFI